jgi:hypothetical protein
MIHNENCMCDKCILVRIRQKIVDHEEEERKVKFESDSQDYIRRRGGIDPRR